MLIALIATLCFHSFSLGSCDDKRQGQIPLPRIGRGNLSPSIFYHILIPIIPPNLSTATSTTSGSSSPMSGELNLIEGPSTSGDELNAWLLSHLDRRKRSLLNPSKYNIGLPKSGRPYASSNYNQQHVMAIEEMIRRSPWAIWALKGVDKKMAFSPRLGRAMTPRLGKKSAYVDEEGMGLMAMEKKAPAFSPRLGRSMTMIDQDAESEDDAINMETRAAFSPRLGRAGGLGRWAVGRALNTRASTFAPRLGRSYNDFNSSDTNAIEESKI